MSDFHVLDVQNLRTYYKIQRGWVQAVDGVTFHVDKKQAMGLAGESGCGKTTIALSVLKILPAGGRIVDGKIVFDNIDITSLEETEMRERIRWKGMSIVFQGAMNALNPVYKISDQIIEAIKLHEPDVETSEAKERGHKLFELVGVDPGRMDNYPHEFSGGMKQRAMIAMSLACNPKLLIADEPGTALDVIVCAQVLKLLRELRERLDLAMILISHDLSIIAETCNRVAIMYGGKIVESGDAVAIFKRAVHPYTQGLLAAFPSITAARTRMISVPGSPPDLLYPPSGCRFHPRCPYALDICRKVDPAFLPVERDHYAACHLANKS
jgi:peptide/nickel transport system ATP-binding protein